MKIAAWAIFKGCSEVMHGSFRLYRVDGAGGALENVGVGKGFVVEEA